MRSAPLWLSALVLALTPALACTDARERPCRIAVKSLGVAPDGKAAGELAKVVAFGHYALPDIEQEFHASTLKGRLRYLDALQRIRSSDSVAFLRTVARWDSDDAVRKGAAELARQLTR
jgi:hypothetical protein